MSAEILGQRYTVKLDDETHRKLAALREEGFNVPALVRIAIQKMADDRLSPTTQNTPRDAINPGSAKRE